MENKIEVGEYVRTKDGIIDKVDSFSVGCCVWHCENGMCIDECNRIGTHLEDIVKHSKQLIALIDVGDFVNGMEVLDIHIPRDIWEPIEIRADSRYTNFILAEDIKTILTKEQFEANCYKVGGEDE